MYESNLMAKQSIQVEPVMSVAQNIKEQFIELNDRQQKSICAIEDKLHEILNKRPPPSESMDKLASRPIEDFNSIVMSELGKLRTNSNRLEAIYNHLLSII